MGLEDVKASWLFPSEFDFRGTVKISSYDFVLFFVNSGLTERRTVGCVVCRMV